MRFLTSVFCIPYLYLASRISCILRPLHLMSPRREILRVQAHDGTRHGNVTRNISYGRIMSRLNCSATSYVQLRKKLPFVILSLAHVQDILLVRTNIYSRETSSQWHEIILNDPSGILMRNEECRIQMLPVLLNKEARIWALFRCHCPCRSLDLYLNRRRIYIYTRASL